MKLYLAQHAHAVAKEQDPQRPLAVDGLADAKKMANFLTHSRIRVQRVIHSGKLRARQTAEILAASIAPGVEIEESGLLDPNDNPAAFDWQSDSWDRDTLIVGHLPFMARMVAQLLIDDGERVLVEYHPGTIVCLEHNGESWRLAWMIRPELFG